jgi:iron complex outermembrane receptor protein
MKSPLRISSYPSRPVRPFIPRLSFLAAGLCLVGTSGAWAAEPAPSTLFGQSLEDLLKVKVSSVAKKSEELVHSASAIHVVTAEDIRRKGAATVMDALRGVPGVNVGQIGGTDWAISIRGFQSQYSSHLLVLIDGRTVYTPMFSGVYWDSQDVYLADIDRIEVIRGPGATVWGANAVNGVINILTKSARDTQGAHVEGRGGNMDHGGGGRYGGRLGENGYYRVYGKFSSFGATFANTGLRDFDGHRLYRTGFRVDTYPSNQDHYTLQGDYYHGANDGIATVATPGSPFYSQSRELITTHGLSLISAWKREFSQAMDQEFRGFYDFLQRNETRLIQNLHTIDLDYRLRWATGERNELTVGGGYRAVWYHIGNNYTYSLDPAHGDIQTWNLFAQDTVRLTETVRLTLGSKLEQTEHFKMEPLPSARLLWEAGGGQTFWGAVSRAVRTPGQSHRLTAIIPGTGGITLNPNLRPEHTFAMVYELGHRVQPSKTLSFDTALFYNDYSNVSDIRSNGGSPAMLTIENTMNIQSYGAEIAANWQPLDAWRLSGSYSFLKTEVNRASGITTPEVTTVGARPMHQASLHSAWNIAPQWELDLVASYVDGSTGWTSVKSYVRLDAQLSWRPQKEMELSIGVQNLLDNRHPEAEFTSLLGSVAANQIPRAFYGRFSYRF